VPIWVVGFVFTISVGFGADRIPQHRTLFIAGSVCILSIMGIATCIVYNFTARYVFLSFMTGGVWGAYSQAVAFMAEVFQDRPPEMRAIAMGIMTAAANTGFIYGAYLFPKEHAPKYLLGFGVVAATGGVTTIIYIFIWSMLRRERHLRTG
jgi:MFS family permease